MVRGWAHRTPAAPHANHENAPRPAPAQPRPACASTQPARSVRAVQWTRLRAGEVPPDVQQRFLKLWSHRTGGLKHESTVARVSRPVSSASASDPDDTDTGQETVPRRRRAAAARRRPDSLQPRDWLRLSGELGPMTLRSGQLRRLAGQAERARRDFSPARELVGQTLTPNSNNRNLLSLRARARHGVPGTKNRSAQKTFPTQPPNLFPSKFSASPRSPTGSETAALVPDRFRAVPWPRLSACEVPPDVQQQPRLPPDHARARKSGSSPRSLPDRSIPGRFLPAAATAR